MDIKIEWTSMRTQYFADKYKDVVKLREIEKKTFKEIGKALGVSSCMAEAAYKKEKRLLKIESQVATSSEDDWTRLPVSTRTKNCLLNSLHRHPQIKKINDFASLTLLDIQQFRNIGKVSVNELVSVLKNYGVNLKKNGTRARTCRSRPPMGA